MAFVPKIFKMDPNLQRKLNHIIDQGYDFRFGDYFDRGINIYKKNIGGFAGFTAIFLLGTVVLVIIPFIGQFASVLFYIPLSVGFYVVARKLDKNQSTDFNDFFKGFDYFAHLLLMYMVMYALIILLMLPFIFSLFSAFDSDYFLESTSLFPENFPYWALVLVFPLIYLVVAWRWAPLFIIFYRMNFWEAMESSRRLVSPKWWVIFLFSMAISFLGSFGYILLLAGLLFTYPASICIDYAAFADITSTLETEAETDIVEHLVD